METLVILFASVLAVLSALLAALAGGAGRRYGEPRFFLLGIAFGLVTILASLAIVAEVDLFNVRWFDETFALEPVPLALLSIALLLVYGAMAGPRGRGEGERAGGP